MSVIRNYGWVIINLTKIISVEQSSKSLNFTMPVSNHLAGNFMFFSDSQLKKIKFDTEESAKEEMKMIDTILNEHYKNKN